MNIKRSMSRVKILERKLVGHNVQEPDNLIIYGPDESEESLNKRVEEFHFRYPGYVYVS
jgi:hypothetical protein